MYSIEDYCEKLLNYFSEIVIVDKNPFIIKSENIYKENGVIKRITNTKIIELTELTINKKTKDLVSPEFYDYGLIQKMRKSKNRFSFYFYPKNIIQRLFKRRSDLFNYLNSLDKENYFVITTPDISKRIKGKVRIKVKEVNCFDELSNEVLNKQIIIFNKSSKVYINNEVNPHESFDDLVNVYCGIDLEDYIVIDLL